MIGKQAVRHNKKSNPPMLIRLLEAEVVGKKRRKRTYAALYLVPSIVESGRMLL